MNSMWDAWKTGYRGPLVGSDAISKTAFTRAPARAVFRGWEDRIASNMRAILHGCVVAVTLQQRRLYFVIAVSSEVSNFCVAPRLDDL